MVQGMGGESGTGEGERMVQGRGREWYRGGGRGWYRGGGGRERYWGEGLGVHANSLFVIFLLFLQ